MDQHQDTDLNRRSPNLPEKENQKQGQQINIPRQNTRSNDGDWAAHQNGAHRGQKFPSQLILADLDESKKVLSELIKQLGDKNSRFDPYKKVQYSKRLMLLEQQIEGLMRQSYLYATKTPGQRVLDYSSLIIEKENQVNQLERKISYLQSQLRMKDQRELELEKQLEKRFESIRNKNREIELLKGSSKSYTENNKYPNQVVKNFGRKLITNTENLLRRGNPSPGQLENQIENWILGLPNDSLLKEKFKLADENWLEDKYKRYLSYLTTKAVSVVNDIQNLYASQIVKLKSNGVTVDYDPNIMNSFSKDRVLQQFFPPEQIIMQTEISAEVSSRHLLNQASLGCRICNHASKISVQIPVQDTRTKALITKLVKEMRSLYMKYPKLALEISPQLLEYLSQQILDLIQVDELGKLVEIVKYKTDVIKVQNVIVFNNQKHQKAEFHLKVLIKALLDEMERIIFKTGIKPVIDEALISMIRQEIIGIVNVEEILNMYRVVPKIVEVEKVVEQVVEKIVPVPHFVTFQVNNTEIVPVNNFQVVKDTINVPLEVGKTQPLIHEKLVLGSQYDEKVVIAQAIQQRPFEVIREIPIVRQVEKIVPLTQEVFKPIQVLGPEKIIPIENTVIQNIVEQKVVVVEKIVERIVQVEKIVQKVVEVVRQVPKVVIVDRIVEKVVPQIKYQESKRVENIVVETPVEVVCYVQKVVVVEKIVQRLVPHPQFIQKLVPVNQIREVIKEVQVIKQVPIYIKDLFVQERIVEKALKPPTQQVIKPVDRIIEFPVIHQKVRVETEYVKQPFIEREEKLIREAVKIQVPVTLTEQIFRQVEKPVIHCLKQQYPKQIVKEKIVKIETVRDNIVPTPFIVEKIIQKIVEVPRIVEIEKFVEKIVPVPRIVEKIVEVEKIIQKIVEKHIHHYDVQPIQYIKEVPIEIEKLVQVQIPQYIYQTKQVPKYIPQQVPVVSEIRSEKVQIKEINHLRVAIQKTETPIEVIKEKLTPIKVEDYVIVELKEQIIVPIQLPIPTTLIEQKLVPVEHVIPFIQPVDRVRQKLVEVKVQVPGQVTIQDRVVEKLFVRNDVRVVKDEIPYYEQKIKPVDVNVEKIITVDVRIQQALQVPTIVEKIVNQVNQIPKVYEVQRIVQVPIYQPRLITADRMVPKIVQLKKAYPEIVDQLHEIVRLNEQMKQIECRIDNIVIEQHRSTISTNSEVIIEKAVIQEKLKQVVKYINVMNESLKIVDRIVEKPSDPIIIYEQKILQVPVIVEQIVERIFVMPQIVEVLKYVYDITEVNTLGIPVSKDIGAEQAEYQRLGKNVNKQLADLKYLLLNLKGVPQYQNHIGKIDRFLAEFDKFLAYPRLIQVLTGENYTADNNTQNVSDLLQRRILNSADLIVKLLFQLQRIQRTHSNVQMQLEQKVKKLVASSVSSEINDVIYAFRDIILNKPTLYNTQINENMLGAGSYTDVYNAFTQIISGGPHPFIGPSYQQLYGKKDRPWVSPFDQSRNYKTSSIPSSSSVVNQPIKQMEKDQSFINAILVDKLLSEVKRIKTTNPNIEMKLDPEINQIVSNMVEPKYGSFDASTNKLIDEHTTIMMSQISRRPGENQSDFKKRLKQYIKQRFELENKIRKLSNEATKYKELYSEGLELYHREKHYNLTIRDRFREIQDPLYRIISQIFDMDFKNWLDMKFQEFGELILGFSSGADTSVYQLNLDELSLERSNRYIRQKDVQIRQYKQIIDNLKNELKKQSCELKSKLVYTDCPIHTNSIRDLEQEINKLKKQISEHKCRSEDHTKCNSQIKILTQQLNRIKIQLNKSRDQVKNLNSEMFKLRLIEKEQIRKIEDLKRKMAEYQNMLRYTNSSKATERTKGWNVGDMRDSNSLFQSTSNIRSGVYSPTAYDITSKKQINKTVPQASFIAQSTGNITDSNSGDPYQSPTNANKTPTFRYSSIMGSSESTIKKRDEKL